MPSSSWGTTHPSSGLSKQWITRSIIESSVTTNPIKPTEFHMRQKGFMGTLKRDEKRRRCRSLCRQNSNYSRERLTPIQSPKRRPMSRAPTSFLSSPIGMNLVSSLVISRTPTGLMWMPPPPLPASFCSPPSPLCSGKIPARNPYATLATGITVFPSAVMASP